ncbi:hypothetical protein [Mesorhizobium sp. LSJC269B00]|uniref:hypothetical protein n=1 Tax=Mesorhizobium sp. LSJC269B00 TaxID=1287326 RepID=UPI0018DC9D60|nr:hypothetical protein [Mesorhizobium sp. LSJC269B00]
MLNFLINAKLDFCIHKYNRILSRSQGKSPRALRGRRGPLMPSRIAPELGANAARLLIERIKGCTKSVFVTVALKAVARGNTKMPGAFPKASRQYP